jgi:hypothetical protein
MLKSQKLQVELPTSLLFAVQAAGMTIRTINKKDAREIRYVDFIFDRQISAQHTFSALYRSYKQRMIGKVYCFVLVDNLTKHILGAIVFGVGVNKKSKNEVYALATNPLTSAERKGVGSFLFMSACHAFSVLNADQFLVHSLRASEKFYSDFQMDNNEVAPALLKTFEYSYPLSPKQQDIFSVREKKYGVRIDGVLNDYDYKVLEYSQILDAWVLVYIDKQIYVYNLPKAYQQKGLSFKLPIYSISNLSLESCGAQICGIYFDKENVAAWKIQAAYRRYKKYNVMHNKIS